MQIVARVVMRAVLFLFFAMVLVRYTSATIGGDISGRYDAKTFKCCRENGWSFMATRSYCSYGGADPNAPGNLDDAKAGGIPHRDVYHFPCRSKGAADQVSDDVNSVGKDRFGTLWFDIETNPSPGCGWSADTSSNCQFLGEMITQGHSLGIRMGVYSSEYMWGSIMGGCEVAKSLPLWYAHYDGKQTFSDFTPFGGWSTPSIKQYWDSVSYCGISADADWYP